MIPIDASVIFDHTRDAHFAIMQRALPALKLFAEPP